jgi:hypothetical protein
MSRRQAAGRVLLGAGILLAALGGLLALLGLEQALTVWNDQLALLPWGLHRILGITVYLEIPADLPLYVVAAGGVAIVLGAGLAWLPRLRSGRPRG